MRILSLIIKEQKEENEEEVECYQVIRKRGGVKRRVQYWKEPVAKRKKKNI